MKKDAAFEIAVCDGRGQTDDVSNYFPVWLPVIGYDCTNSYLDGVSSFLFLWAFLWVFCYIKLHQIIQFCWDLNVSLTISFWPTCFSHFQCNKLIHIRMFHSAACSESKCQIHYQFSCFAFLNWAIASEATRLKFIVRKFMTWEFSCPGNKMMW